RGAPATGGAVALRPAQARVVIPEFASANVRDPGRTIPLVVSLSNHEATGAACRPSTGSGRCRARGAGYRLSGFALGRHDKAQLAALNACMKAHTSGLTRV